MASGCLNGTSAQDNPAQQKDRLQLLSTHKMREICVRDERIVCVWRYVHIVFIHRV